MAATKRNAMLIEEARQKIRTTQLINRLQSHALGTLKKPLEATQVKAIEILLRKSVPDLTATELSGPQGEPIKFLDMSAPEQARHLQASLAKLLHALHRPGATA